MRTERQIRQELKHQKALAIENQKKGFDAMRYWRRVHLLSWVLGESTTF
jgi:hypothetical protein